MMWRSVERETQKREEVQESSALGADDLRKRRTSKQGRKASICKSESFLGAVKPTRVIDPAAVMSPDAAPSAVPPSLPLPPVAKMRV